MIPTTLEKIVNGRRLPILFIGSGISKRYLYKYPNWEELLEQSFLQYNNDSFQLQKHINKLRSEMDSDFYVNTHLASIIEDGYNEAFFDRRVRLKVGNSRNPSWVKRGISPYKMYLSDKFKKMSLNRDSALAEEMNYLRNLKNKVSAVITTNYDLFLETHIFTEDYTIFKNQEELFSPDSYNIAEIYKIHGCASDANSLVVTEKDYNKFIDSKKLLIAKMLTLFAESPIIFMGYSLTDENILSIITDFLSCLSINDLKSIHEHFVFVSWKEDEEELIEVRQTITTNGISIPISEIQTNNFEEVFKILNLITPGISPVKVRETKRVIKNIVDANIASAEAESVLIEIDDLDRIDLSDKPLAIAIGYKDNLLSKVGYGIFDDEIIFEDIIYDNKKFDATRMCNDRYKSLAKTRLLPVFKYVKNTTEKITSDSKLYAYIQEHNEIKKIITPKVEKTLKNVPTSSSYDNLLSLIDLQEDWNKKSGILLKNITTISLDQLRSLCMSLFDSKNINDIKNSTHFKRCVMYLDFMENFKS